MSSNALHKIKMECLASRVIGIIVMSSTLKWLLILSCVKYISADLNRK